MSKSFTFQQFHIDIDQSGMPVSTDGILLGAWANVDNIEDTNHHQSQLLDIGTGTGLLALMAAQRNQQANIDAVELMPMAYQAATKNIRHSPWHHRIALYHQDIADFQPAYQYHAIICNPPYFNAGEQSKIGERASARHTDTLSFETLLQCCHSLLLPKGRASFILPVIEGEHFIQLAHQQHFHITRKTVVKTTERKPPSRLLIELSLFAFPYQETALTIHKKGQYSDEFVALTQHFYLNMK